MCSRASEPSTGAAGALDQVIAETFAAEGADVAGLDLDAAELDATDELVWAQGRRWTSAAVDVTDLDAVQEAVGKIVAEWGGIDVLLNSDSSSTVSPFHEMTSATWTTQMDRDLDSVFNVTRAGFRRCSTSAKRPDHQHRLDRGGRAAAAGAQRDGVRTAKAGVDRPDQGAGRWRWPTRASPSTCSPRARRPPGPRRDSPEGREALLAQMPTRLLGQPARLAETVVLPRITGGSQRHRRRPAARQRSLDLKAHPWRTVSPAARRKLDEVYGEGRSEGVDRDVDRARPGPGALRHPVRLRRHLLPPGHHPGPARAVDDRRASSPSVVSNRSCAATRGARSTSAAARPRFSRRSSTRCSTRGSRGP